MQLSTIMDSTFRGPVLGSHVPGSLGVALAFFALAWAAFNRFARETKASRKGRGALITIRVPGRWLTRSRVWPAALAWKDFHFLTGGRTMVVARAVALTALIAFIGLIIGPDEPFHVWAGGTLMFSGKGAGCWPTTESVMGDLFALHRIRGRAGDRFAAAG